MNLLKLYIYRTIQEYNDPPNENFPDHEHADDELLVILEGEMLLTMESKEYVLKPGDELLVSAKVIHAAKMGSSGCKYIVGEKTT